VTVTNAGTYTAQSVSAPSRAGQLSPTGTVGTASNWHFVSKSTEVAGQVGTQFGIEFRTDGNPVGDGVTLHMVLNFPSQGIRNPNTGDTTHTANIAFPNLKIGALCLWSAMASTMLGKSFRGSEIGEAHALLTALGIRTTANPRLLPLARNRHPLSAARCLTLRGKADSQQTTPTPVPSPT
jgi:hypothetical protein